MNVVDVAVSAQGTLLLLMEDGAVNVQERVNSVAYQHLAPSARPEFSWQRIPGPPAAVITRILVRGQDILLVGDGLLWQRVRDSADPNNLTIPAYIWRPLTLPGNEPAMPVNPPAPVRAEILTIADGGSGVNTTANPNRKAS